jgi:hypothetical protein
MLLYSGRRELKIMADGYILSASDKTMKNCNEIEGEILFLREATRLEARRRHSDKVLRVLDFFT